MRWMNRRGRRTNNVHDKWCFLFSRNIGQVTSKINCFHYLKKNGSKYPKNILFNLLNKTLMAIAMSRFVFLVDGCSQPTRQGTASSGSVTVCIFQEGMVRML